MNALVYLIQVNLFLLLFYGFYKLFLCKETFNNLNRGYLVIAAITAFAVPFLQSDYVQSWFVTQQVNEVIYTAYYPEIIVFTTVAESPILWTDLLSFLYLCVVIILSIRLIVSVLLVNRLFSNFTNVVGNAFSFFGKVVVDDSLEEYDTILHHEKVHSKHLHSADVILFEVIAIVCWFNPVVYFYKNAVRNIHEFIADELASETLKDKAAYATLLVSQQFNIAPSVLTNSFYKPSTIKLRIEMLLKKRSTKTALLKYGLIAPLFLVMMVLASATVIDKEELEIMAESVEVPLTELPSIDNVPILSKDKTTREIKGYVKTSEGGTLAGALVVAKGSSGGTITNKDGYFKLNVNSENIKLIISFIGYESREISIEGITEVTVKLIKQGNMLDEMVVVGYDSKPQNSREEIFTTVEQNPEFPGGVPEMYKYIGERIKYPSQAQQANIEGKVFVKFVVQKNGEIGDINILKGIGGGCDEEAVRVISQMPKWTPGTQNGEPVNVYFTMPIAFEIQGGNEVKDVSGSQTDFIKPDKPTLNNGSTKIKINGNIGEEKPLFVVDGIVQLENTLQNIKPDEIATINVLKGAAATSVYGQRGDSGVIVITTKKASVLQGFLKDDSELNSSVIRISSNQNPASASEMKDALFIVNGVEMTRREFRKKYGKKIKGNSLFIYRSAEAVKKFGDKGKNGVVIIKTKD